MKKIKDSQRREIMYSFGLLTQIGINMLCCIAIGFFIGRFLDGLFHTSPIFLIIFIIMGVCAAFKNMFTMVERSWKE